jgi:hypothetical protein
MVHQQNVFLLISSYFVLFQKLRHFKEFYFKTRLS